LPLLKFQPSYFDIVLIVYLKPMRSPLNVPGRKETNFLFDALKYYISSTDSYKIQVTRKQSLVRDIMKYFRSVINQGELNQRPGSLA